jgi:hypothetical protein
MRNLLLKLIARRDPDKAMEDAEKYGLGLYLQKDFTVSVILRTNRSTLNSYTNNVNYSVKTWQK